VRETALEGQDVIEEASSPAKLWYQRLKLDNKSLIILIVVLWIAEYAHLPFTIDLPLDYFLSFNALTLYVDLGVFLLLLLYPKRILDRFRKMLDQLKLNGVLSEGKASQVHENAMRQIHGKEEKYIPFIIGALISFAWIYGELSKGLYGVLDFPDLQGNVSAVSNYPITVIHESIVATALFFIPLIGFSTFIVIWKTLRSMVPKYESINLDIISPGRVGGLGPIGKLMLEVVLLVMVISTTYAALGAVYFIITGQFNPAIIVVTIFSYSFLFALIAPPVFNLHKFMKRKKKETLDELELKIKTLKKQVTFGDMDDERMRELGTLLQIHEEVEKMRTFPLDESSSRKIVMFILSPALASIPAVLEPYLGKTISFIPIVIVFSIITQMISFKFD
jgi:hypothetical protein